MNNKPIVAAAGKCHSIGHLVRPHTALLFHACDKVLDDNNLKRKGKIPQQGTGAGERGSPLHQGAER